MNYAGVSMTSQLYNPLGNQYLRSHHNESAVVQFIRTSMFKLPTGEIYNHWDTISCFQSACYIRHIHTVCVTNYFTLNLINLHPCYVVINTVFLNPSFLQSQSIGMFTPLSLSLSLSPTLYVSSNISKK